MPTSIGRSYNPLYAPMALPWVTNRFYDSFAVSGAPGTVAMGTSVSIMPFLVPNTITITSIGIEITGAAIAGTTCRLALYDSDQFGLPYKLLLDAGTVAADATGFNSKSISLKVQAGIIWGAGGASASGASARAISSNPFHFANISNSTLLAGTGFTAITISTSGAGFNLVGFPEYYYKMADNSNAVNLGAATAPRIMLGV